MKGRPAVFGISGPVLFMTAETPSMFANILLIEILTFNSQNEIMKRISKK